MTDIASVKVNDFISFVEIVAPEVKMQHVPEYATGKARVLPAIPPRLCAQTGGGIVLRLHVTKFKDGDRKVRTASVDAGKWLGVVKAVLDTAEITGVQSTMFDEDAPVQDSMYVTDAKGGA